MKKLQTLVSLSVVAAALSVGGSSRADLPPPEGTKFVSYSFTVEGLAGFKDFVVFAYPWSLSNGAPTKELTVVEDRKPVRVGRRSANPKLYAMPRAAFEEWIEDYKRKRDNEEEPPLDTLIERPDVVACSGAPTPRFSLPSDDKRSAISQKLTAIKIGAGVCTITAAPKPATPAADTPTAADSPAAGSPESASAPPGKSGCGSCAVGSPARTRTPGILLSGLASLLLLRRRHGARRH